MIDALFTEVCRRQENTIEEVRSNLADLLAAKHL